MNNCLSKLRKSARANASLPVLTQSQIARRWQLDPDTVRKILRKCSVPAVPGPWKRSRYSILEIWRVEGVSTADLSDQTRHEALFEPLLTASDLADEFGCVPATIRNYVRENHLKSIRLGGSIRFRWSDVRQLPDGV